MRLSTKTWKNTQNTQLGLNYLKVLDKECFFLIQVGFIFEVIINGINFFVLINCET